MTIRSNRNVAAECRPNLPAFQRINRVIGRIISAVDTAERIFGKMFISDVEDGAVLSIAYRSESWVSRDHPTRDVSDTGREGEIGGKIGEGRARGFRAINYRDRVGRGARDGKYPVTRRRRREEKWIHPPRTY